MPSLKARLIVLDGCLYITMTVCVISCKCSAEDLLVSARDLPQTVQSFLASPFSNTSVAATIKEGNDYEIRMDNGWEMEFDHNGQWENIDCKRDEVPVKRSLQGN